MPRAIQMCMGDVSENRKLGVCVLMNRLMEEVLAVNNM